MQHNEDARFIMLLEKWQSGDFSRKEARELEELARTDAFRKEAWEGFQSLPEENHQKTIAALRARLRQKYEHKPGFVQLRILLSAAAVGLLLLATVWLFRTNPASDTLAQQTAPQPDDSLLTQNTYAAAEEKSQNQLTQNSANQSPEPNFAKPETRQSLPHPNGAAKTGSGVADQLSMSAGEDIASAKEDRVVATEAEAVMKEETPPAPAMESIKTHEPAAKPLDKKTPSAPSSSMKKKAKENNNWSDNNEPADMDKLRREARKKELPARTEPGGGWEMFNDYLRQNARLTPQAAAANISGTVRLQFSVNDNGEPQGIIVLRSLGYGLDQEARRLVENWVWIKGNDPFISVDIPFSR